MIIQFEDTMYDLTKLHTKQLLKLYKKVRFHYCYDFGDFDWREFLDANELKTLSMLKEELATREHVPNKKEAKALRKQEMLERSNRSNRKYRNR